MKKSILNSGKILSKAEQKLINGGGLRGSLIKICIGTGTGGASSVGSSTACIGYAGKCTINGYLASCNGNGSFWFY